MDVFLSFPFAALLLLAVSWLVVMARLLLRLAAHEPRIYAALGRPVLRLLHWQIPAAHYRDSEHLQPVRVRSGREERRTDYTPDELRGVSNLLEFVLGGRFHMLRDARARDLAAWLRNILALFPLGLVGFALYATRTSL